MNVVERINRWRHTKGYGVHSPLAFRFLNEALRQPEEISYYGYECLYLLGKDNYSSSTLRRARMLLRIVSDLQPAFVWTSPEVSPLYTEAIRLAGGVIRVYDGALFPDEITKADLVVLDGIVPESIGDVMKMEDKAIVCFNIGSEEVARLASGLRHGILFDGIDSCVVLLREGVSPMIYTVLKF